MFDKEVFDEIINEMEEKENANRIPKNLVQVRFDDGLNLVYFSDLSQVSVGDVVTVDGKMKKQIGVVTKVSSSFKKPKFDMKWIVSKIDNDVSGSYFKIEDDVVSLDANLTVDKFINIYAGIKYEENLAIGEDNIQLNLEKLEESELFNAPSVKERGKMLYINNAVQYIWLKDGVGKAVVRGSSEWHEIDFRCKKGRITYIACDCPFFGECKHLYAFLLKLRDFSIKFFDRYQNDSFVTCSKSCFNYIMLKAKGKVTIDL